MLVWLLIALVSLQAAPARRRPPVDLRMHGYWQGTLSVGGETHTITLGFWPREPSVVTLARRGRDDMFPLRASQVSWTATSLKAAFTRPALRITGTLRSDASAIDIVAVEAGASQRVTLTRASGPGSLSRPQTPVPPLPYDSYDDYIDTGSGVLAATLTLPRGRGPFPGVVLLSGTGAQDRDNSFAWHRPFWVLADSLTRRGYAVLRADDRGAGRSSGLLGELRTPDADALDAIALLR